MGKKKERATTWNYRVIRQVLDDQEVQFAIHEVHSTNGRPDLVTEDPVPVTSDSLVGLRETLRRMLRAAAKPVLEYEGFGDGGYHAPKQSRKKKEKGK